MLTACTDCTHQLYPRVDNEKDADAVGWVFKNEKEFVPYYFKFPPIDDKEIRVKILYTGLCHSDVMTARQKWGPANYPLCPGHEVIGEVVLVGKGVTDKKVGDWVGYGPIRSACWKCRYCQKGLDNLCSGLEMPERILYGKYFGGYASHIQQPATHAIRIPKDMDISTAPPLLCAGATVFSPMARHIKDPQAKVGVIGIGGLGHLAVQYAKKFGNYVAGFTTSESKVEEIKKLGADEVIVVSKDFSSLKDHQDKFDYLVNTLPISSEQTMSAYLSTATNNGTLIQVGLPDANTPFETSFPQLLFKQLTITTGAVGSVKESEEAIAFAHKHGVKVQAETFAFEDFPKAFDLLENGKPHFRCVVNVKDFHEKHFHGHQ